MEQRRREWEQKKAEEERQKRLAEQRRREFEKKQEEERQRQLVEQRRREWEAQQQRQRQAELAEQRRREQEAQQRVQQLSDQRRREWEAQQVRQQAAAREQIRQQAASRQQAAARPAPVSAVTAANSQSNSVPIITNPGFQRRTELIYPHGARSRNLEGQVIIRANVTPTGAVSSAVVFRSSGHRILDEAAVSSVRQWVFTPAQRNGKHITSIVQLPVTFRLQ